MKPSDIFGVFVRSTGFLIIVWGLWQVLGGVDNFLENIVAPNSDSYTPTFSYFLFGVPGFLFGAICFFLADWIVKLAYRD